MSAATPPPHGPAVSGIIRALAQLAALARIETDMVQVEMRACVARALSGLAAIVVAVVFALTALDLLAAALIAFLAEEGVDPLTALVAVGGGLGAVALIVGLLGFSALRQAASGPTRTMENLRKDAETIGETWHDQVRPQD